MATVFQVQVRSEKGELLNTVECPGGECTIGKARDNLIPLRGWRVANYHAVIHRTSEGLFVEDKTGDSRVTVNGKEVPQYYGPLHTKDTIGIADYRLIAGIKIEADAPEKPKAAPKDGEAWPALPTKKPAAKYDEDEDFGIKTMFGVNTHKVLEDNEELSNTLLMLKKDERFKWRNRVHEELLSKMDLRRTDIGSMNEEALRLHIAGMIREIVTGLAPLLPANVDKDRLISEVLSEAVGLGPLEELLADETVTEIMVNKYDEIYIEIKGKLTKSTVTFSSDNAVMSAIERIVSPLGRRIDESSPMVDARLKDGSRVNAIIPPLALRGPCLTIRKFSKNKLTSDDIVRFGALDERMVAFLKMAVSTHRNMIISGGTGSGKTTLLNMLSNFIPETERIITVEDAAELKLNQPHVVSLEARPANLEGKGAVPIRDLMKNCLRMRPDRIVVGECRGGEALDMLQAMNTGHDGSLTTAHANTPRDLIARLEVMVLMSGMDLPVMAIREQVASAIHIIVQQSRFSDGSRKVTAITEVTGVEQGVVQMQDIYKFQQDGFDQDGKVKGRFVATGCIPEFYDDLRKRGLRVDMSIFE